MADVFRQIVRGILLRGETSDPGDNLEGSIWHNSTEFRIKSYLDSAIRILVSEDQAQTLTNKSIDADVGQNTLTNVRDVSIAADADITRTKMAPGSINHVLINDGSGEFSSEAQLAPSRGGTGIDLSAADGIVQYDAGVGSVKQIKVDDTGAAAITTFDLDATVARTITVPDADDTMALLAETQTLTNKTIGDDLVIQGTTGSINKDTGSLVTEGGLGVEENINAGGDITALGNISGLNLSGTNTGDITLAAVGATPNADGATLVNQVLNLEPADSTNPGVVTTSQQLFAGLKYFNNSIATQPEDVIATGTIIDLTNNRSIIRIAGGAATTVQGILSGLSGQLMTITNINADDLIIQHENAGAVAANRIVTPDNADITVTQNSSVELFYDGTAARWRVISTPSTATAGSGINYIPEKARDFEINAADLIAYDDGASATPVDGTGAATGNVTVAIESVSPLRGSQSARVSKAAVDGQGEGVRLLSLTLDPQDRGKGLYLSYDYTTSANYVSGDIRMFAYLIGTNQLVSVVANQDLAAATTGRYSTIIPTQTDTTEVRILWHIATTNATAYDIDLDNLQFGPEALLDAAIISEVEDGNLTIDFDNNTVSSFRYRKGEVYHYWVDVTFTGTPTTGVGIFTLDHNFSDLPDAYVVGSNWLLDVSTSANRQTGTFATRDTGTPNEIRIQSQAGGTGLAGPFTWTTGDRITGYFTVPIEGVQATATISNQELNNQVLKFEANGAVTNGFTNGSFDYNPLIYPNVIVDTQNGYNPSTGVFTIPETGLYRISAGVEVSITAPVLATTGVAICGLFVNSSDTASSDTQVGNGTGSNWASQFERTITLNAGDLVQIYQRKSGTGTIAAIGDTRRNYVSIERVIDLSVFGAYVQPRFVTKFLTADVTTDTTMTDLTVPVKQGQWYKVTVQFRGVVNTGTDDNYSIDVNENGNLVYRLGASGLSSFSGPQVNFVTGTTPPFQATANGDITFTTASIGPSTEIQGNGTNTESFITVEEIIYHQPASAF